MNYTIRQLQILHKVAEKQSVTKAATELHLTQPAVSMQLKNLQAQFNIPLYEVIGRRTYITEFGEKIVKAAEEILREVEAIDYHAQAYTGLLAGKLKISVVSTGKYVMPYILADFLNKHPGIELIMDVTNKAQVVESLERNEVDFSLVSVLPQHLQLCKEPLMENKLFVVANRAKQYAETISPQTLLEELPLIYREQGSGTRYVMEQFLAANNLVVKKKLELTSNEAVKQAVLAGLGVSIMPLIGIRSELASGELQIIPVEGFPIKSIWHLVWQEGKAFSPVAEKYLQHLRQEKQDIIQQHFGWIG